MWGQVGHVVWDYASAALLLGWLTTAVFCAVAGTALATWARWPWPVGFLLGLLGLGAGLALLATVGGVRAAGRRSVRRETPPSGVPAADVGSTGPRYGAPPRVLDVPPPPLAAGRSWGEPAGPPVPYAPPFGGPGAPVAGWSPGAPTEASAPAVATRTHRPPTGAGWRTGLVRGWRRWTRTPATRAELVLVVLCIIAAGVAIATVFLAWVKVRGPAGVTVYAAGPFEIQLGLFVVLTAVATIVSGVGLLRWRSGWWPVLLAWCGTWWAFLAVAALSVRGELGSLSRLLDDTIAERVHVRQQLDVVLGPAWTVVLALALLLLVIAVGMLALQRRDPRRVATPRG